MESFGFLLKSYLDDFDYVDRLLESFNKYNKDGLKLFLVVPDNDFLQFNKFQSSNIIILKEEIFENHLVHNEIRNIRPGYINQEIIKLSFWELNYCSNYMCLDSDGVFLRNFYRSDFMFDNITPYTILVEDNELKIEPEYYNNYWKGRDIEIRKIIKSIGLPEKDHYLTCHGFGIFSSQVLSSFFEKFMKPNNYNYSSLLEIAPYEFSWYNFWLQFDKTIEIHIREPLFKYFHHKNHHLESILKNLTSEDISRGYIGLVINSNYSRFMGVVNFEEEKFKIISNYFKFNDIIKALFFKITQKIKIKYNALQRN